jgi:[acyl-carrier-protein] S-malonyltransferase
MQSAVPLGEGGMTALIGAEIDQAEEGRQRSRRGRAAPCVVANDNAPGQVVISGTLDALWRVPVKSPRPRASSVLLPLPVSAPFHCPLMQPAADKMAQALAAVTIRPLSRAGAGQCHCLC